MFKLNRIGPWQDNVKVLYQLNHVGLLDGRDSAADDAGAAAAQLDEVVAERVVERELQAGGALDDELVGSEKFRH